MTEGTEYLYLHGSSKIVFWQRKQFDARAGKLVCANLQIARQPWSGVAGPLTAATSPSTLQLSRNFQYHSGVTTRRSFVRQSATGIAAVNQLLNANPLGLPIGCQVYPVREQLGKDFDGTLRELSGAGFKSIEMCSPQGYGGSAFTPLQSIKPAEMRQRIHAAGLQCDSSHYTMREFREHLPERIEYAKELGLKQMIMSSFAVGKNATMSDWLKAAG